VGARSDRGKATRMRPRAAAVATGTSRCCGTSRCAHARHPEERTRRRVGQSSGGLHDAEVLRREAGLGGAGPQLPRYPAQLPRGSCVTRSTKLLLPSRGVESERACPRARQLLLLGTKAAAQAARRARRAGAAAPTLRETRLTLGSPGTLKPLLGQPALGTQLRLASIYRGREPPMTCRARAGGAKTRTRPKRRGRESAPDRQ
jgi:hypothetical protein